VEASEGVHDGRGAEEEDARAALEHLAARFAGIELWGAGFSFGARTVISLATREPRIARLVCAALPVKAFDCSAIVRVRQPLHLIQAGNDEYGNAADLRATFPLLPPNVEVDEIAGVDHFFRGETPQLEARVKNYASRVLEVHR
jgi:alpha/beta superfamily hydrolase